MSTNLEDISSQVKLWRSQKRFPQEKMSSELRERIYSLREHMSDSEIIRSLELSYSFFTTRKSAPKKKSKSSTVRLKSICQIYSLNTQESKSCY